MYRLIKQYRIKFSSVSIILALMIISSLDSCHLGQEPRPTFISYYDLNVVGTDGTGQKILVEKQARVFLLTGNGIVWRGNDPGIIMMNYDGSDMRWMYTDTQWADWTLTTGGDKILLSSHTNNYSQTAIYLMNIDGNNLIQLASEDGYIIDPHISPNLDEIAFEKNGSIATIQTDGSNFQIIKSKTDSSTFCMLPLYVDENTIVYFERTDSCFLVELFDKTKRTDKFIGTSSMCPAYGRVLSGSRLLCTYINTIKMLDLFTSKVSVIAQGFYATFSLDGTRIVYTDDRTIYIMNSDGSDARAVYTEKDAKKSIWEPELSPDNRCIVFQTMYTETIE